MKKIKQIEKKQAQFITRMTKMYKSLKRGERATGYTRADRRKINSRKNYNPISAGFVIRSFTETKRSSIFRDMKRNPMIVNHEGAIMPYFFYIKVCLCRYAFGVVGSEAVRSVGEVERNHTYLQG